MKLLYPKCNIDTDLSNPKAILKDLEKYARVSHKSENNISRNSYKPFIKKIISLGHESILEHKSISVKIIGDRGLTHELVRHRLASYTQESSRFCDYSGGHVSFIIPTWTENIEPGTFNYFKEYKKPINDDERIWLNHMFRAETVYKDLELEPQFKRGVLPINLKTEIVTTFNLRMWRHVFKERIGKYVHPQINNIMSELLIQFHNIIPIIFDDIYKEKEELL